MIQRRPSVQNDIFLHNATPDFCNTISCQALGNSHFSVQKNSPIVFLPDDYLCAQKDIREMFSPKYMESFRHADSLELQEVLSVPFTYIILQFQVVAHTNFQPFFKCAD